MKYILVLTFCFLFTTYTYAQIDQTKSQNQVNVEEIFLAKDDGSGKAGEKSESFMPTDIPIYCVVQLDSMKSAIVKMNLVAVKVNGVKPETKVITVSFKTDGSQSRVSFKGAPQGNWVAGNYRFDIFVDDKPAGKKDFEIQSVNKSAENKKPKNNTDSALAKRFRQN